LGEGARTTATLPGTYIQNRRVEINRGTAREGVIGGNSMYKDTRQQGGGGGSTKDYSKCREQKAKNKQRSFTIGYGSQSKALDCPEIQLTFFTTKFQD
jgi:hypothetical protein